jgi:hypothetical protein
VRFSGLVHVIEIGAVALVLGATAGLLVVTASAVGGQSGPAVPAAPPAPATPAAPASPVVAGAPDVHAREALATALVAVNRHRRGDDAMILLGESLIAVSGRPHDARPLATVLVEALRGHELSTASGRRLAAALAAVLVDPTSEPAADALRDVEAALRAAGVGGSGIVIVETELKRFAARGR